MDEAREIVVFDGVCNLCTGSVRFILEHEADDGLLFTSLQSTAGQRLLREAGFDPADARTIVVLSGGRAHARSNAVFEIARHLRWPWRLACVARIIPGPVRDWLYDRVAARRYDWFGRRDTCMVPEPGTARRFLVE